MTSNQHYLAIVPELSDESLERGPDPAILVNIKYRHSNTFRQMDSTLQYTINSEKAANPCQLYIQKQTLNSLLLQAVRRATWMSHLCQEKGLSQQTLPSKLATMPFIVCCFSCGCSLVAK